MPTAENARLQYEAGQNSTPMSALTDSGDHKNYTSGAALWSGRSGYEPKVIPNGLATGGAVSPAAGAGNNNVDVAALSCYLSGVKTAVGAATDEAVTRGSTQPNKISSITVTSGGAIAVIAGTEGASMVETRAAAGGPPLIPVGSIEIAQVRLTSTTAAPVTEAEIFSVPGNHTERWDYPVFEIDRNNGEVNFAAALGPIHTGNVARAVFASYAAPIFADVPISSDYVTPENSHSVSSTQVYGKTIGSTSSTLGQGGFTAYLNNGIDDPLVALKDEVLWFKFFPNKFQGSHNLAQGKLGISRTWPSADSIAAACTISAEAAGIDVQG